MPPVSPARISLPDRYKVVRHVANGGMASVWEAHDELLDRPVAVKLLAQHLSEDERARMRFEREARAAAGLSSHANVVTIYDVGEHDGRAFMVMELMRGGTVADVLRRDQHLPHQRSVRWLKEAASALDAAHAAGVVHRDIKPANLLLDERDRLAVADFGIARLAWEEQLTQTGQVLGTAAYLSPEQAMGNSAVPASDRYALAIVAFELLTGEKPFTAEHFAAQARAHIEDDPPRASELEPELTTAVDDVLDRGMAKEPDDRWESAEEFIERLDEAVSAPPPRRRAAAAPPLPDATAATRRQSDGAKRPPAEPRRAAPTGRGGPGRGTVVAVLAGLVLAAILAFALLGDPLGNDPGARKNSAQREATPTPSPTATATATPAQEQDEPAPASTPKPKKPKKNQPAADDPSALQLQAFNLNNAGKPEEALPYAQKAVELCKGSTEISPCGYALFEYGKALRLTGNPQQAVAVLEERLQRFPDNQRSTVEAELERASKAAGE